MRRILNMLKISDLFNKIKKMFSNLLTHKKSLMLEEGITNIEEDILIDNDTVDNLISSSMFTAQDKSDFFEIYENVKKGIIKLEDLLITEMIQVELMMQEEMKLLNKKTSVIENQIINLNTTKNMLKKEEQYYYEKYKNKI